MSVTRLSEDLLKLSVDIKILSVALADYGAKLLENKKYAIGSADLFSAAEEAKYWAKVVFSEDIESSLCSNNSQAQSTARIYADRH